MSFEKYEWQKGETITAEKLNRMEDGIEEAMQSGGCDVGYECVVIPEQVLFSEKIGGQIQ